MGKVRPLVSSSVKGSTMWGAIGNAFDKYLRAMGVAAGAWSMVGPLAKLEKCVLRAACMRVCMSLVSLVSLVSV